MNQQQNYEESKFAAVMLTGIAVVLTIPTVATFANAAFGGGDPFGDQIVQVLTLTAIVCLTVIALAVLVSRGVSVYFQREIARMRAVTQAYEVVRQDYEWKNKLYHHERHHPALSPTEIDPAIRHIEPFVPLKRRVKRQQDRFG